MGEQWWNNDYEYTHLEAWVIVALVLITLAFDTVHHKTAEWAMHTEKYAMLATAGEHRAEHHSHTIWEDLHHRATGELSVLGFLALLVWGSNQVGLFDAIAEQFRDNKSVLLPPDGVSYLHSIEAVHMHLFLAMCLYFVFLALMVFVASKLIHFAVVANDKICQAYSSGEIDEDATQYLAGKTIRFSVFFKLRNWYFSSLQGWRGQWTYLDEHVAIFQKKLSTKEDGSQEMHHMLRTWFPFDIYVVVTYRIILDDMIEIMPSTWMTICVILLAQALIHKETKTDMELDFFMWLILSQLLILSAAGYVIFVIHKLAKAPALQFTGNIKHAHAKYQFLHRTAPVKWVSRLLQLCLFFSMYEFARTIASKHHWQSGTGYTHPTFFITLLLSAVIPEGFLVGLTLPLFTTLAASGNQMQESHVKRMVAIVFAHLKGTDDHLRESATDVEHFEELVEHALEHSLSEKPSSGEARKAEATASLRAELSGMTNVELRKRAVASGVNDDDLEEASDADDAKAALIELIVALQAEPKEVPIPVTTDVDLSQSPNCAVAASEQSTGCTGSI